MSNTPKWNELRPWCVEFLEKNKTPVEYEDQFMYSPDIRIFINNSIIELDAIFREFKNGDKRRVNFAKTRVLNIYRIKKGVESRS